MGPWRSLIERALKAYLITDERAAADRRFEEEIARQPEAFWGQSLAVAPEETAFAIRRALIDLIAETDPKDGLQMAASGDLADRPRQILGDLLRLAEALDGSLPGDLAAIRTLLGAPARTALHPIRVCVADDVMRLTRWQGELVRKLNLDAERSGAPGNPDLAALLARELGGRLESRPGSALDTLQRRLFVPGGSATALDGTVQCVGVRDSYEEAETAAGMAQKLLAADPGLRPAEIGVLLPEDPGYALALEDAFSLAGLALSGLTPERRRRDLGTEAVLHFLSCRQKPAPAMALAACLSSPLMPWSAAQGAAFARRVMDGRQDLTAPRGAGSDAAAIIDLIGGSESDAASLSTALRRFVQLLAGGEEHAIHRARAAEAAARVCESLERAGEIDWVAARRAATPAYMDAADPAIFSVEGVTVLRERHEPWRDIRHLFVLGFHEGNYPREVPPSAVFPHDDLGEIRTKLGIPLESASEKVRRRREQFRRQLRAAGDSVTLLTSRRTGAGEKQHPSASLVFMEPLFGDSAGRAGLVSEVGSGPDRARIRHLALASPEAPAPPRDFRSGALRLGRDLLALPADEAGTPRIESPSSLETLLVSPLAWLLRRTGAMPVVWVPETASPSVLGSLVHGVFERLFRPGGLPAGGSLARQAGRMLDEVTIQQAPFIRSPQWRVERLHLAEQSARAAEAWRDLLEELGAEVVATEQWLEGEWSEIPVHGQADAILALGRDQLLIVDYKWSTADAREQRMASGQDTQASIYRALVRSGGPKPGRDGRPRPGEQELRDRLRRANQVGIAYFMMKDRLCLADQAPLPSASIKGWHSISGDVGRFAAEWIAQRLADARKGIVPMNVETDRESFGKTGIPTYALDASPLVGLFTQEAGTRSEPE